MSISSPANALAPISHAFILYPHTCYENVYERACQSVYLYTCLYNCTIQFQNFCKYVYMGEVMELQVSCYLVLLSIDNKTR